MSNEPRIADRVYIVKAPRIDGEIQHENYPVYKVEIFGAYQFRNKHSRINRNFFPRVPIKKDSKKIWYSTMYRVRINDKWHSPSEVKYQFFDLFEISALLTTL